MKYFKIVCNVIVTGFAIASFITLIMFLAVSMASDLDSIRFDQFILILLFSIIISASMRLFALRKLHIMIRIAIQYFSLLISFMLLFLSAGNIQNTVPSILIFTFAFTLLYAVLCAIIFPILKASGLYEKHLSYKPSGKAQEKKPYQSIFS